MFDKKLKEELRQSQANLSAAIAQAAASVEEAERLRHLYGENQREANEKANRLPNFLYGLAEHEATLQCVKPHYASSGYSYIASFKPHLHIPGNIHTSLELDDKTLNLLTNLTDSIGIKGWVWTKATANLVKPYNSDNVTAARADMEKAEAELQALLDEAVRVNKMKAAFAPEEPAKKEKG